MAYHVAYNPELNKKYPEFKADSNKKPAIMITTLCIAVILFISLGVKTQLKEWLIPGEAAVTQIAFSELVGDVQNGTSVKEAFTTFCVAIIENAESLE